MIKEEIINCYNILKVQTIKNYQGKIDVTSEYEVNETIMKDLASGKLNNSFTSPVLNDMDEDEKQKLLTTVEKYISLCFYEGNIENWGDSIETRDSNCNLITGYILDNFNFLLSLLKDSDEKSLQELTKYMNKEDFNETATIEYLRNTFTSDEVLKEIIIEMSKENSLYNLFTEDQKAALLTSPIGTLYFYSHEGIILTNPILLALEIQSRMKKNNIPIPQNEIDKMAIEMAVMFKTYTDEYEFRDIVDNMSDDYQTTLETINGIPKHNIYQVLKDINGEKTQNFWNIQNNPLVEAVPTPYSPKM